MNLFTSYIILIFIVKILFIGLEAYHVSLKIKGQENTQKDKNTLFWKDRIEFIFIFLMSLLLIYLFNPRTTKSVVINGETKLLLFLFGIVLLITADWNTFIKESKQFKRFQNIV